MCVCGEFCCAAGAIEGEKKSCLSHLSLTGGSPAILAFSAACSWSARLALSRAASEAMGLGGAAGAGASPLPPSFRLFFAAGGGSSLPSASDGRFLSGGGGGGSPMASLLMGRACVCERGAGAARRRFFFFFFFFRTLHSSQPCPLHFFSPLRLASPTTPDNPPQRASPTPMSTNVPPTPNTRRGVRLFLRTPIGTASAHPTAVPTQEDDNTHSASLSLSPSLRPPSTGASSSPGVGPGGVGSGGMVSREEETGRGDWTQ
jgi:hypothetical protein